MNPYACRIVLRPRSPLEVLDLSVRFARVELGALSQLAAVWLLPVYLVALAVSYSGVGPWPAVVAILVLAPALQLPFTMLGARRIFDATSPLSQALQIPWGAAFAGVMSTLSAALVGLFTCSTMWLPAHIAAVFVQEAIALEGAGVKEGARRALTLTADQAGKAIAGGAAALALGAWVIVASEAVGQVVVSYVFQLGTPFGFAHEGDVTPYALAGLLLAQPAMAWFRLLLYLDVRTCREGWDLQIALAAAAEDLP